jgi:three-Cys-motif partner protein
MRNKLEATIYPDPRPDLLVERGPEDKGVGRWVPEQKYQYLIKYIDGTREAAKKWSSRVLIDPFCGPGRIQVKGEELTRDGGAVVAWRQSVLSGAPFTQVLVGDLSAQRADACAARLSAIGAPVESFPGAAAETVSQMVARVPARSLCLVYLDPYNLELLSFDMIRVLAKLKSVDFAVHFSNMDLSRNVEFEFDPERARFDDTAPGWRSNVKVLGSSKTNLPSVFFDYWMSLIKSLNFSVSHAMPIVRNDTNHGIYRLVFFSRHPLPNRIWGDVARGPNRELFD